jgi:tripartite-type tricarboxylate transporter receptor subunit TctC
MILRSAFAAALAIACKAHAQGWPVKTVRIVVPIAAGGGTDANARILSPRLSERRGQSVVVERDRVHS